MLKTMIELRYEPKALARLIGIWPNSKKEKGTTAYAVSKATGLSQQSILNFMEEDSNPNPSWKAIKAIEAYFDGIVRFVVDTSNSIDNEANLKTLEAFLDKHVYPKSA